MVAYSRKSLIRHLPVGGAAAIGIGAVASFLLMPTDTLESLVWHSGIAAIVAVAQPPLGMTARAVLALGSGVLSAAVAWSALYLMFGTGGFLNGTDAREDGVPVVRRADAHPDAPPRKPMSAADLGRPMMEVSAAASERPIPANLDLPLAAFDPRAIRPVPMEPVRPVAPLAVPIVEAVPTEAFARIATFDLPPIVATRPIVVEPGPPPSIESLLRRLEQGAGRRRQMSAG